ncbi:MAG: sugar dehydrogenase complex small subunit [Gammaproteobacteria bacterium]
MESINLPRRKFLKNFGLTLASGLLLYYSPAALSLDKTLTKGTQLSLFNELLTTLTTNPNLSPTLTNEFYKKLMLEPESVNLQVFLKKLSARPSQTTIKELVKQELQANTTTSVILKKIISMCYLGTVNGKTVSGEAFKQSLVWGIFGSTAPGICAGANWQNKPVSMV